MEILAFWQARSKQLLVQASVCWSALVVLYGCAPLRGYQMEAHPFVNVGGRIGRLEL